MASRTLLMLRRNLMSLLAAVCLLHAPGAEAKPDNQEENPAALAEVQTKAAQGFVKQELELAADYYVGKECQKILLDQPTGIGRQQTREIPPHNFTLAICIPLVWVYPRIRLRPFDGTDEPHPQIIPRQR